jgi:diguanylate cyclase (GGDEF)-like protein
MPERSGRRLADEPSSLLALEGAQDRTFAAFLAVCGCATFVLFGAGFVSAPSSQRPELLPVAVLAGAAVALAIWSLRWGFSPRLFLVAGVVLMALGVVVGATLPDGLDAATILPLAGAIIVLPVVRGRLLLAMFVLAFGSSVAGEVAAHVMGGLTEPSRPSNLPVSLAASTVLVAFAYGLVWRVSHDWLRASEQASQALAGQRQLLALNERLVATLDPQQVLNLIADSLKELVAYDNLTIYRVDREAQVLRPVLARDRFASLILEETFALDSGITGWVVTHAQAQCVNDALLDPRMTLIPGTPAENESLIIVPLLHQGDVIGTLNVGRMGDAESHFDRGEFEITRLFAGQASTALVNAEVHRAVSTQAETDALTGLLNRRAFETHVIAMLADPASRPLTLLMLDLDSFKAFNDRHGHPAGDVLLVEVARSIETSVRTGDRVYRQGGDELGVLLPATSRTVGVRVGERIRAAIAELEAGDGGRVTVSVGAACSPDDATNRDDLVAAADVALYRAKATGGDRVVTGLTDIQTG